MNFNEQAEEITSAAFRLKSSFKASHKHFPLKMHEMGILMTIARIEKTEHRYATPSQLSEYTELSRPAVTPILNMLEENGYIERVMSKEDRRSFYLVLTEKGAALVTEKKSDSQLLIQKLLSKLGEDDTRELIRLMKKTEQAIKEITNES